MRVGTYILIIIFVSAKRRNRQLALSSVMLVIILFRVIEVVKFFENASLGHINLVNQKLIAEFLTIAIYIAGYEAIWKGYTKIYKHLRT